MESTEERLPVPSDHSAPDSVNLWTGESWEPLTLSDTAGLFWWVGDSCGLGDLTELRLALSPDPPALDA